MKLKLRKEEEKWPETGKNGGFINKIAHINKYINIYLKKMYYPAILTHTYVATERLWAVQMYSILCIAIM